MNDISRRQLLATAGVGLGIATAGCTGSESGGDRRATVFLQQSEDAQAEIQQETQRLRGELQTGNLTREEASQQISELRSGLNEQLMSDAETEAKSLGLTVEDSLSAQGGPPLLLVRGPSDALVDYVELDIVNAMSSASRFDEIQQQQQQQQQQETQTNQTAEESG